MQLQFRNAESSLHWHGDKFVPIFIHCFTQWSHTLQCTRAEQPQHHPALPALVCAVSTQKTCRTPHQQSKRPDPTRWMHFPFIFIAAAVPRRVTALRNLISAVLSWQEKSKIRIEMETQFWGVMISHYRCWNACLHTMIREDIFQLLPQHGVLPPQRASK